MAARRRMPVRARLREYERAVVLAEWLKQRIPRAAITLGSVTPNLPPAPELFALLPGGARR